MCLLKYYHKKNLWLSLFILCTILILVVSVIPFSRQMQQKGSGEFRWDYLEHFLAYFVFGGLFILWRSNRNFSIRSLELAVLLAVSVSFSIGTEYVQLFIPGRAFNPVDALYNLAGLLTSVSVVYFFLVRHYLRKRQTSG